MIQKGSLGEKLKESVIEAIFENALFIVMLYHACSLRQKSRTFCGTA